MFTITLSIAVHYFKDFVILCQCQSLKKTNLRLKGWPLEAAFFMQTKPLKYFCTHFLILYTKDVLKYKLKFIKVNLL